jgi:hypothetical protein
MGSNSFFSKAMALNPFAQELDLPGAHKYAQGVAQAAAGATDTNGGAYTGVAPTLAGANAGYQPGGPGATVGFKPTQYAPGAMQTGPLGAAYKAANLSGNAISVPTFNGGKFGLTAPNYSTNNNFVQGNQTQNPWVLAAGNAARQSSTGGPY